MIDYDALTIKEFLGVIFILLPILVYVILVIFEFIARIREKFESWKP